MEDLYTVLGLSMDCTASDVRTKWLALVKRWHPDLNRGREEEARKMFIRIHRAFEVLRDPVTRADYDQAIARNRARVAEQTPPSGRQSDDKSSWSQAASRGEADGGAAATMSFADYWDRARRFLSALNRYLEDVDSYNDSDEAAWRQAEKQLDNESSFNVGCGLVLLSPIALILAALFAPGDADLRQFQPLGIAAAWLVLPLAIGGWMIMKRTIEKQRVVRDEIIGRSGMVEPKLADYVGRRPGD